MSVSLLSPSLPAKFQDRILTDTNSGPMVGQVTLKQKMDEISQKPIQGSAQPPHPKDKPYIQFHPSLSGFVVKKEHPLEGLTPDTLLYRVRKADKIRKLITKHGFSNLAVVPEKWLYHNGREWVVVAQKLALFEGYTKTFFFSQEDKKWYTFYRDSKGNFKTTLPVHAENYHVTARQGHALATLAFEAGLNDLGNNNVLFTKSGESAILDTEPIYRKVKKDLYLKGFKRNIRNTAFAFSTTKQLKQTCTESDTINAIESVERYHYNKMLIKIIVKVALAVIFTLGALVAVYKANKSLLASKWSQLILPLELFAALSLSFGVIKECLDLKNRFKALRSAYCETLEISEMMKNVIKGHQAGVF